MQLFKRVSLFLLMNVLVMASVSIVLNVLGIQPYLTANGINYMSLMAFCLVWGFGGALISLALSRVMAKWMMGVKIVDANTQNPELRWLVLTTHKLAKKANLPAMPEVGYYESDDLNAFATGPTKKRSLVAVSTGLLRKMSPDEVEGVLAHEVAHIANGDMVTMTLVQGVVNAFVMFFARIIAWAISQNVDEEKRGIVNMITVIVLEILFSILGMFVIAYFSRAREFRADKGGSDIGGRDKMVAALRRLNQYVNNPHDEQEQGAIATLKISTKGKTGLMALLSTHPPLELRIAKLEGRV